MLSLINYIVWVIRMKIVLKVYKVWEVIEGEEIIEGDKNNMIIVLLF